VWTDDVQRLYRLYPLSSCYSTVAQVLMRVSHGWNTRKRVHRPREYTTSLGLLATGEAGECLQRRFLSSSYGNCHT